jgi:hypothetical protein
MRYEVRLLKTGDIVGYYHSKSNARPPAGTELEVAKDITPNKKREIKASVWYRYRSSNLFTRRRSIDPT